MAIRFRKSKKLMPGIKLNVGKKSASVRIGGKNAGYTIGTRGRTASASLPGTGLGVTKTTRKKHAGGFVANVLAVIGVVVVALIALTIIISIFG